MRTICVLATDMVDSTAIAYELGPARAARLRTLHFEILDSAVTGRGGRRIADLGDGILAEFGEPAAACAVAVDIQRAVAEQRSAQAGPSFSIRVGVCTGDVDDSETASTSPLAAAAEEIANTAGRDEILVSESTLPFLGAGYREIFGACRTVRIASGHADIDVTALRWNIETAAPPAGGGRVPRSIVVVADTSDGALGALFEICRRVSGLGTDQIDIVARGRKLIAFPTPTASEAVESAALVSLMARRHSTPGSSPPAISVVMDDGGKGVDLGIELCDSADPGALLVAGDAARLASFATSGSRHAAGDLIPADIAGKTDVFSAEPTIGAQNVTGISDPIWDLQGPDFVGRSDELDRLRALLLDDRPAGNTVAVLRGEAGVGKSRLVAELAREAYGAGRLVLATSFRQHGSLPLDAFARLVRAMADRLPIELLFDVAGDDAGELSMLAPELRERVPSIGYATLDDTAAAGSRVYNALSKLIANLSVYAPIVLVLEDLHWADESSLACLAHLARNAESRVRFVITIRPDVASDHAIDTLDSLPAVASIQLGGIDAEAATAIVGQILGRGIPETLAREVERISGGNAFFIQEVAHLLADRYRHLGAGSWDDMIGTALDVPDSVRSLVEYRLRHLDDAQLRILTRAAVIGPDFDETTLAAVSDLAEDDLRRHLDTFLEMSLVRPGGRNTLRFSHALVVEVLEARLVGAHRSYLHARVASAVEAGSDDNDERVGVLAHHFSEAGPEHAESAAEYQAGAATIAVERAAFEDARRHIDRGLLALENVASGAQRDMLEIGLRVVLGRIEFGEMGYGAPAAQATFESVRRLCERVPDSPALFPTLWGLSLNMLYRGELAQARRIAARYVRMADQTDDAWHRGAAHNALAFIDLSTGDYESAVHGTTHALTIAGTRAPGPRGTSTAQPLYLPRCVRSWALWLLGKPDQANEDATRALEYEHEVSSVSRADMLGYVVVLETWSGYLDRAAHHLENLELLAADKQMVGWMIGAQMLRGSLMSATGDHEGGASLLESARVALETVEMILYLRYCLVELARAYLGLGDAERGLAVIAEAVDSAPSDFGAPQAELIRLRAELMQLPGAAEATATPSRIDIETELANAQEHAHSQRALSLELRAAHARGRYYAARGHPADAAATVDDVLRRFEEGFDTADLRAARAFLASISGRTRG